MVKKLGPFEDYILLAIAMLSVQVGSSFAKDMLATVSPLTMTWLRLTFGGLLILVVRFPKLKKQVINRKPEEWLALFKLGVSIVCMNTFFYLSINTIHVGMAVTIEFMGPLAVGLIGLNRRRDLIWVALAAIGVVILGGSLDFSNWQGILFACIAGLGWFGYIMFGAKIKGMWSGAIAVVFACTLGSIVLSPFVLYHDAAKLVDSKVLMYGLLIGLMSTALPMVLELRVIQTINLGVYGVLTSFEPAVAVVAAFFILDEVLSNAQWLAVSLIIIAAIGVTVSQFKPRIKAVEFLQGRDKDKKAWNTAWLQSQAGPIFNSTRSAYAPKNSAFGTVATVGNVNTPVESEASDDTDMEGESVGDYVEAGTGQ